MSRPLIKINRLGGQVSIQDLGRRHSMHQGVTESGAADSPAFLWANKLLNKPMNASMLEITLGNLELEFLADCQVALTGADLAATCKQMPLAAWHTHTIKQGERLSFGFPKNGLRAYLAVNATLDVPTHYESQSGLPRESLAGALVCAAGTVLHASKITKPSFARAVPSRFIPDYQSPLTVGVMLGYQAKRFAPNAIKQLFATEYRIRSDSNRMAYRMQGSTIDHDIEQLYSEGIAYGAIQVPPDGQPVILLNDRQTMGGYPKVGCVTRMSGAALAQRMPGSAVRFELANREAAASKWINLLRFFGEQ